MFGGKRLRLIVLSIIDTQIEY